jgi:translation initiation factor IF-3
LQNPWRQVIFSGRYAIDFATAITTFPPLVPNKLFFCRRDPETDQENTTIRRPFKADAPVKEGPRSNREIRVPRVQLIDEEGQNLGSMPTDEALKMAEESGLDLVEIKYSTQKKAAEARKKQKIVEVKEIKMRPNIDTHDYDVKMKAMNRFFEEGDKVKVTLKFRGREMAHQELGMKLLLQVKEDTQVIAKVEAEPKLEGRQMMMVLAPK